MTSSPNSGDRERFLAELARREAGEASESLQPEDESTLAAYGVELDTLVNDLRQPPPIDAFEDESGCRRAIELAEQVGLRSEGWSRTSNATDSHEPAPERIGPYQITAKLGRGGMGAVYRALHDKLKRVVAVKVLPAARMKDAGAIARFEREMEAIGALNHPNIVTAHDAGEAEGMHYLVMECVEGLDLAALSQRAGPLPVADACEIIRQAAQGLKAAYDRGIVHRDLKPSNLMLAAGTPDYPQATVKVLDFGLARLAPLHADLQDLTNSGQILGTLKYMAPEQCTQSHAVDVRADIYSLGATLYKLLCGSSPFSDERFDSPLALLSALASEEPPRLAARRQEVPPKLEAIVQRMMAKNPADRFASPSEVIDALAPWTAGANLSLLLTLARKREPPTHTNRIVPEMPSHKPAATPPGGSAHRPLPWLSMPLGLLGGALVIAVGMLLLPKILDHRQGLSSSDPAKPESAQGAGGATDPVQRARALAQWLLPRAGEVEVSTLSRGVVSLQHNDPLPDDFRQLVSANLDGDADLSDEDLARFDRLPLFTALSAGHTRITDAGLSHLGELPRLQLLFVPENAITNAGLEQLKRYPELQVLHLYGTQVSDAGLESLADLAMLTDLSLVDCGVTDEGLKYLTGLKRLQILALNRTGVTARGVAMLQQSLAGCEIRSDYSQEELAEARESLKETSPSQHH